MTDRPAEEGHENGTDCTPAQCSYGRGHSCQAVTKWPSLFVGRRKVWRRGYYLADDVAYYQG